MLFTALVIAAALAWAVALGRQALPPALRAPLWRATARQLARDAARGWRELDRLHREPRRPGQRPFSPGRRRS